MALVGYGRVSTIEQGLQIQLDKLKDAGCEYVYAEHRSGAETKNRPELEAAISSLRKGDVLVVTKLDRFGRNVLDVLRLLKRVEEAGAFFRCLDQPIATDGPMGQLMLTVLAAFAQFELDIRAERQKEGIAAAKAAGKYAPKPGRVSSQKLTHCSRWLRQGLSFAQVHEKAVGFWGDEAPSIDTLQRKFPDYKNPVTVAREQAKRAKKENAAEGLGRLADARGEAAVVHQPPPVVEIDLAGMTTQYGEGPAPKRQAHLDRLGENIEAFSNSIPPKKRGLFGFGR